MVTEDFAAYLAQAAAALEQLDEQLRSPRRAGCRHKGTSGTWLSAGHVVRCLGVPGDQLVKALLDGRLRSRTRGDAPRTAAQVLAADAHRLWPQAGLSQVATSWDQNARAREKHASGPAA